MKKSLSTSLKTFYGVGEFGFTLMTNVEMYFLMYFMTTLVGFDAITTTAVMTITAVIDMITAPMFGSIMNAIKAPKWGRYRSWLIITTPLVIVFYTLGMFEWFGPTTLSAILICTFMTLAHFAFNFQYSSSLALISIISTDAADRGKLSSMRATWAALGRIAWSYMGTPFIALLSLWFGSKTIGYTIEAGVYAVIMGIGMGLHFLMTKGYEISGAEENAKPKEQQAKANLKEQMLSLFKNPSLLILLLADFTRWLVNFVMAAGAIYFFTYVLNNIALMATYLFFANIGALIGSYVMRYLVKLIGNKYSAIFSYLALGVFLLLARYYVVLGNSTMVIVFLILAQFMYGIVYAMIPTLYGDAVIYSEWKTGKKAAGFIMGMQYFPLKVGVLVRGPIIAAALLAAGYAKGAAATPQLSSGLANAFAVVPAIGIIIGALLLLVGYGLSRKNMEKYTLELSEKSAQ